jgi:CHASE2 domain-containing sensor protein
MIAWFSSLADRFRRTPVPDRAVAVGPLSDVDNDSGARLLRNKRTRVAIWAVMFGLVAAVIDLPLPAEDFYRAVRAIARTRAAPSDVAVIAVDDKTLAAFGSNLPGRDADSRMLDRLFEAGVKRVVFDRAHAQPQTPEEDAQFAATLERHKGKIWLGMVGGGKRGFQTVDEALPLPEFRKRGNLAAMNAYVSPFGLSMRIPTGVMSQGRSIPSLSAALSGYTGPIKTYRPDFAFNPKTIPSYSYVDIVKGKVPRKNLEGQSVIVGDTYLTSPDFVHFPLAYGRIAGVYYHALGANTLNRGDPVNLYWYPALLAAAAAIMWLARSRTRSRKQLIVVVGALIAIPMVLDDFVINLDIMPALMALAWAGFGFHRINRKYFIGDIDAMTTSAISSERPSPQHDIYALKIANLAELSEDWSAREIGDFVNTLISYVKGPGEIGDVAFERDLLVWLAPRMENVELERHADGLALMLKTAINHDWQSSNNAPALGIDTNHELPLALRIKKAMQAADEAVSRGARFIINDAAHLEARNQRLELIRQRITRQNHGAVRDGDLLEQQIQHVFEHLLQIGRDLKRLAQFAEQIQRPGLLRTKPPRTLAV